MAIEYPPGELSYSRRAKSATAISPEVEGRSCSRGGRLGGQAAGAERRSALPIAPFRREARHHGFQHLGQNRRRRVVVEVDHNNHPTHAASGAQESSNRPATEVVDSARKVSIPS